MVHCLGVRTNKRLHNQRAGLICAFLSRLRQRCYRPHQSIYRPHYAWGYFLCAIFPTKVFSHPLSHCREHILRRRAHFKHLGFANAHFCTPLVPTNCKCSWAVYRLLQVRGAKSTEPNFTHFYCSSLSAVQEVNLDISFSGPHFSFQNLLVSYRILVSRQNLGVSSDTMHAPNFFCLNVLKIR